jgi:hypothetical protein
MWYKQPVLKRPPQAALAAMPADGFCLRQALCCSCRPLLRFCSRVMSVVCVVVMGAACCVCVGGGWWGGGSHSWLACVAAVCYHGVCYHDAAGNWPLVLQRHDRNYGAIMLWLIGV